VGEGIAIRTATFIFGGELELSSVIEIFAEFVRGFRLVPLSADEEAGTVVGLGLKNILAARVSKEGEVVVVVVPVETSAVRRFSSSSPLGVGPVTETGGSWLVVRLGVEPEEGTEVRGPT